MAYGADAMKDGIYRTVTRTRYNAAGNPLVSVQKSLVSNLSDTLESKNVTINERNLTSAQRVEYHNGTKRTGEKFLFSISTEEDFIYQSTKH